MTDTIYKIEPSPFSLHAAVEAARTEGKGKPRRIALESGNYYLDRTLKLDHRDNGLTIEAAPKAKVILYGGRKVTGWKRDGKHFYSAVLPGVKEGKWDFRSLVVNGRMAQRARLPKEGTFSHLNTFDVKWMSTTGGGWQRKPTKKELTSLKYKPGDFRNSFDARNAELTVYHMWDESLAGISSNDQDNHILTFSTPLGHPAGAFGAKKYVVWNLREGMTKPGQWYLDRTGGKVVYWPLPGEDMSKAGVIAPTVESIIRIGGTRRKPVRDIAIRGVTFSATTTPLMAGGFGAGRFDGAVSIAFAENCCLSNLHVLNVGGQGIKVSGCNLRIEGCHVHHTGACGIRFGGTRAIVSNNHIHHAGVIYPSAIALSGSGKGHMGSKISHNEIHDIPYTGIACGGDNHEIADNLIYRAMQELHDGAGIYITFCKNIVVRGNFVRDIIDTGGYGASAYYLDEQAENCLVEGNLSLNIANPSQNHMAEKNTMRNNVFIVKGNAKLSFPKSKDYSFEKNVIHATGEIVFTNPGAITNFKDNVLFSTIGRVVGMDYKKTGLSVCALPEGRFVIADPQLVDYDSGKVGFGVDSPAVKIGINPINVRAAGLLRKKSDQ